MKKGGKKMGGMWGAKWGSIMKLGWESGRANFMQCVLLRVP